jgi:nucleoside 2-deoxyribosyltransferase
MNRHPRIYLAGPIGHDPMKTARNSLDAIMYAEQLALLGANVFVPHMTLPWQQIYPKSYEQMMTYDFEWIDVCDAIVRFPGDSPGAEREVAYAKTIDIPVFTIGTGPSVSDAVCHNRVMDNGRLLVFDHWIKSWKAGTIP